MAQVKLTLPDDILAWIEDAAGQPVTGADRIPGGASREGWFVDVEGAGRRRPPSVPSLQPDADARAQRLSSPGH